ncbi:MAG: transcription antitermination factor NusB [Candidatus Velthaea sp.]
MSPAIASKRTRGGDRTISAREVALQVVRDVFADHPRGAREALDYRARAAALSPRDRGFATELAYGSIKLRRWLDYQLAPYLGERAATLPKPIAEIVRLGMYQLRAMSGVEAYAAVSESVGLARRYGHKGTAGLVNAVLRKASVEPARGVDGEGDDADALRASLPTWLVTHWRARFSATEFAAILAGVNAPAALGVCVDLRAVTASDAFRELQEAGVESAPSPLAADALVVDAAASTALVEERAGGRWHLQSESACFPVDVLDPQRGDHVFEACAGRGNKSLQLVSRIRDVGRIECVDTDARKIAAAREHLAAARANSIEFAGRDASVPAGDADCSRVLVDAPCSALGIVGRQPEARWRKDPSDPARLAPLQRGILAASAARVAPGGTLVYSVCSTDPREGENVVEALLHERSDFARAPVAERYAALRTPAGDILVPPGVQGRDGFYIARLARRS